MEQTIHDPLRAVISFSKSGEIESYTIVAGNPEDEDLVRRSLDRLLRPALLDRVKRVFGR